MRRIPSLAILSFVIVLLVQAQAGPLSAVEAVRLRGGLHSERRNPTHQDASFL